MAKCKFCSAEIPADSIFCTECGGKDPIASVAENATTETSAIAPKKNKKGLVIAIIAAIVALILIAGGVLLYIFSDDLFNKDNNNNVVSEEDAEEESSTEKNNSVNSDFEEETTSEETTSEEVTSEDEDTDSDIAYIKNNGKIVIGITNFAPMDYRDNNGEWIGFDAELATAFANKLGVDVEFVEINWSDKVNVLNNKEIDLIWNGMTLTDEVKSAMDCSNAYCNNAQVVVVKADVADKYKTAEDCKDLNFAVASYSQDYFVAMQYGFTCTEVAYYEEALDAVMSGTCDATIIDAIFAESLIGDGTYFEDLAYTVKLSDEEIVVGCRTDSDLLDELNIFINECYENGTIQNLAEKYRVQVSLLEQ